VCGLTDNSFAISLLLFPSASKDRILFSCLDKGDTGSRQFLSINQMQVINIAELKSHLGF